jgi:hypothetical protein
MKTISVVIVLFAILVAVAGGKNKPIAVSSNVTNSTNSTIPVNPDAPQCNFNQCGDIGSGGAYVGCTVIFSQCADQGQACTCFNAIAGGRSGTCNVFPAFGTNTCLNDANCPMQPGYAAHCFNGCCEYLPIPPTPSPDPGSSPICPLNLNNPPCASLQCVNVNNNVVCSWTAYNDCNVGNSACSCACSYQLFDDASNTLNGWCSTNGYYGIPTPPNHVCSISSPNSCWGLALGQNQYPNLPGSVVPLCCEWAMALDPPPPQGCLPNPQDGWGSFSSTVSASAPPTTSGSATPTPQPSASSTSTQSLSNSPTRTSQPSASSTSQASASPTAGIVIPSASQTSVPTASTTPSAVSVASPSSTSAATAGGITNGGTGSGGGTSGVNVEVDISVQTPSENDDDDNDNSGLLWFLIGIPLILLVFVAIAACCWSRDGSVPPERRHHYN